jgi:2,3,4,5-tetrahydropyridine-2-carboxylate N-succinyltransferase
VTGDVGALERAIGEIQASPSRLESAEGRGAVEAVVEALDEGRLRVAEKVNGAWQVRPWVQQAVLLYFRMRPMERVEVGPFEYHDKIPLKTGYPRRGVRVVPPAVVRRGAYLEPGVICMPSYVNIGAWVGSGTMVDTWATVGSCAQVGRNVHVAGGVGIGGVLEPPGARPVIIEDGCFLGSRCIVVEGVLIEEEAVLGANVTITASTPIVDVTGKEPVVLRGRVPPRSVVVPGTVPKGFPAGTFQVQCALVIGQRKESTDKKTSLNQALRDFGLGG